MPSSELHYFSRSYDEGEQSYRAQFVTAAEGQMIGEKSASYLPHPETPDRLRQLLPEAKLIVQLRNPIERAYSDYCMHYRRGQVSRDPSRYLDAERTSIPRLLADGFYHRHLMNFLRVFPETQLKIVLYDDIRRQPSETFREVCGYLGIDQEVAPGAVGERIKNRDTPVVPPRARRLLAPLKEVVKPLRQTRPFQLARAVIARRLRYPPLTPEVRARLAAYYAADVGRLGELLGRDLSAWLAPVGEERAAPAAAPAPAAPMQHRPASA